MRLLLHLIFATALVAPACGGNSNSTSDAESDTIEADVPGDAATEDVPAPGDTEEDTVEPDDVADVDDTADVPDDVPEDVQEDTEDSAPEDAQADTTPPTATCAGHEDCQRCAYPTAPATVDDCYCVLCPVTPLDADTCNNNREAWNDVCGNGQWSPEGGPCPTPRCLAPEPVACIGGACIDACAQNSCPDLPCPVEEQRRPSGECCARCTGSGTCETDEACTLCFYPNEPASDLECQCPICPVHPMTTTTCDANAAAFETHCGQEFQSTCPVAICLPQAPPTCGATGYCEREPYRCDDADDCVYCRFGSAPLDASDCVCPGCGTAMTRAECEAIEGVVAEVCEGFAFDACVPNACAEPPPLGCDFPSGLCTMQWETPASP